MNGSMAGHTSGQLPSLAAIRHIQRLWEYEREPFMHNTQRLMALAEYELTPPSKHHPKLVHEPIRQQLIDAMKTVYLRLLVLFCIDVELWEMQRNGGLILELGLAIYDPRGQQRAIMPHVKTFHIIIHENAAKRNGKFVPDAKDFFMGKELIEMHQNDAVAFVQGLIDYYFHLKWPCHLVGHALSNDIRYFNQLGLRLPDNVPTLDSQTLFALGRPKNSQTNLRMALQELSLLAGYMHNGANDAYFTMMLLFKLCDPEIRRMLRWDEWNPPVNALRGKRHLEKALKREIMGPNAVDDAFRYAFPDPQFVFAKSNGEEIADELAAVEIEPKTAKKLRELTPETKGNRKPRQSRELTPETRNEDNDRRTQKRGRGGKRGRRSRWSTPSNYPAPDPPVLEQLD